jgi:hypothetical protein
MAPEQAKGKSIDRRADIWASGPICSQCRPAQHDNTTGAARDTERVTRTRGG